MEAAPTAVPVRPSDAIGGARAANARPMVGPAGLEPATNKPISDNGLANVDAHRLCTLCGSCKTGRRHLRSKVTAARPVLHPNSLALLAALVPLQLELNDRVLTHPSERPLSGLRSSGGMTGSGRVWTALRWQGVSLRLLQSAGRCGHVFGLWCGSHMRRWP